MSSYDKIYTMDTVFSIWMISARLRVTYVTQGWLIVWDHEQSPPTRHDCKDSTHQQACASVVDTLRNLAVS